MSTVRTPCLTDEQISALIDGLASPEEQEIAARHIAECSACEQLARAVAESGAEPARAIAAADALPRGARVGRYEIVGLIGAGAMGAVYRARDPSLDRKVALKIIRAQVAGPELEARMLREAKAMARLSHPEIVSVYDAGRDGERLFITMELVEGGTLRQWLSERRRSWREILGVYVRAGHGLALAHASGLVHRDFKPDNVLVGADGRVRVTDFGLARAVEEPASETPESEAGAALASTIDATLTRTGALLGTPAYMAPEQLAGAPADARSDVYAFCVSLYEALYGTRPFAGTTLAAQRQEKMSGAIRAAPPDRRVPAALRRAILVGLRPRPADRYASMDQLLRALERASRLALAPAVVGGAVVAALVAAVVARAYPSTPVPPVPTAISPAGCASHRACVESHGGAPYVCRASDKTCVAIASEDCAPMFEPKDLVADDTVWLGAMFPTKGPAAAEFGAMNMEGANFARAEIAQATRALDGSNASQRLRRIAIVGCDDSVDPMRAATHLVDLEVPAILGFRSGQEIVDVAGSLLVRRGVLTVASLTSSPLITHLPQPPDQARMVWRTTYGLDVVAEAVAAIVGDALDARAKASPTRVTLVRLDQPGPRSFAETVYRKLHFNGKTALENGSNYQEVILPEDGGTDLGAAADKIVASSPTFMIVLMAPTLAVPLMERVEARSSARKPVYVMAVQSMDALAGFLGKSADRRHRVYGVFSVSESTANARFVMRYNEAHQDKVTRTFNPGSSYDAFYALAYATFALGSEPISGPALGRAFGRLVPPGRPIEVGPSALFEGISELGAGRSIDLEGADGPLDFDLAVGEALTDMELFCSDVDAQGRATGKDVSSGLVFRAKTKKLEGAIRCP